MKTILALSAAAVIVVGGVVLYVRYRNADPPLAFRTVPIKKGDIVALVSATGTLEPQDTVDVGSQVTGPIAERGKDPKDPSKLIDYDSEVDVGDLLVKVDDSVYRAQYNQADANLAHAKADLGELQAHQVQCEAEWKRADALRPKQAIADTDYDLDVANYKAAVANVKVGLATIKQCEAALAMAKRNLDYCTITSPVKGVVIDRRVNVGQTVVSAMSVSSLFLIAKDLTRMQVWASVNEADIGRIRKGMPVTFTVDAYPNETFKGTVYQIRMNATMNQNVVTYTVVVDTENPDLRLYPYLTANVSFQVERHDNVLKVPNGALRWNPQPQMVAPEYRDSLTPGGKGKRGGNQTASTGSPGKTNEQTGPAKAKAPDDPKVAAALEHAKQHGGATDASGANDAKSPSAAVEPAKPKTHAEHGQVWIKDGLWAKPVRVQIGVTDGIDTEVSGPGIEPGVEVITGEVTPDQAGDVGNLLGPPKLFNRSGGPPKTRP